MGFNVASIYPLPQFNTVNSLNNYISTANRIIGDNGGNVRVDYHPNDRDSGFARYSYEDFEQTAPNPLVGGSGTDWFLFNTKDFIFGQKKGEVLTQLN